MHKETAPSSGFRQQVIMTLALLPIMFGIWYAAGDLLAGPAVWLADVILHHALPSIIADATFDKGMLIVITQFGELNNQTVSAGEAGHQMAVQLNPRLVSYSIPFYAALLWASRIVKPIERFAVGLFFLWLVMSFGLVAIALKDLMLVLGDPLLSAPGVPHANVIAVAYQFSVLLAPSLAPVLLWLWQLRESPLWQEIKAQLEPIQHR